MVGLFKYLFYRVYWWNTSIIKNESYPLFGAVVGVSFFQVFNIMFVSDFILYIFLERRDLVVQQDRIIGIIIVTIVLALNGFYFHKKYATIIEKAKKLEASNKRLMDVFVLIYITMTLMTTIGLAYMIRNNI